ncbi:unnamed protein product, partial [Didymodactylos carnosus]
NLEISVVEDDEAEESEGLSEDDDHVDIVTTNTAEILKQIDNDASLYDFESDDWVSVLFEKGWLPAKVLETTNDSAFSLFSGKRW